MPETAFTGLYRGVCMDNRDTEKRGRIKVVVPQVTGVSSVLDAWPCHRAADDFADVRATPPKKGMLPSPNLPKVSQGVWVMFEGGLPDKPVWIGVF